jgi:hypothetical protein
MNSKIELILLKEIEDLKLIYKNLLFVKNEIMASVELQP